MRAATRSLMRSGGTADGVELGCSRVWIWSGSAMFSAAVRLGSRLKLWKTNPTFAWRNAALRVSGSAKSDVPLIRTSPESGSRSPERRYRRVLFPAPLGPIMATNSPCDMSRLQSLTIERGGTATVSCLSSPVAERRISWSWDGDAVTIRLTIPPLRKRDSSQSHPGWFLTGGRRIPVAWEQG